MNNKINSTFLTFLELGIWNSGCQSLVPKGETLHFVVKLPKLASARYYPWAMALVLTQALFNIITKQSSHVQISDSQVFFKGTLAYKRKRVEIETDFLVTSFICGWPLSHALYIYLWMSCVWVLIVKFTVL